MLLSPPPVMKDAVLPANLDTNHSPCNLGPTSVYNSPEPLFPDSQYPPKLKAASIQCDNVKSALFPESQDPAPPKKAYHGESVSRRKRPSEKASHGESVPRRKRPTMEKASRTLFPCLN